MHTYRSNDTYTYNLYTYCIEYRLLLFCYRCQTSLYILLCVKLHSIVLFFLLFSYICMCARALVFIISNFPCQKKKKSFRFPFIFNLCIMCMCICIHVCICSFYRARFCILTILLFRYNISGASLGIHSQSFQWCDCYYFWKSERIKIRRTAT